jgi:hypothetical protein
VALQLDQAHEGPRFAVRSIEDFQAMLCAADGYQPPSECLIQRLDTTLCVIVSRFEWLGYAFHAGMLPEETP